MSIENAIVKLAEAIELHAKTLLTINQPVNTQSEQKPAPVAVSKEEIVSEDKPKRTRKSKVEKTAAEETLEELEDSEESKEESNEVEEKDEFDDELEEVSAKITAETVKDKAKQKIAKGFDKSKIKSMISALGADSILDLKPEALVKLDKQLDEIK